MGPETRQWTQILAQARARLLAGHPGDGEQGPREEILSSWRRSYDDGVDASRLSSPYDDNLNLATRLVRAAEPVIGRVHQDILGSPLTVVLADSKGKVLLRRSGETTLEGRLDAALLAPGFNYSERYVGTNGIGTALEGRVAAAVRGPEHFNEALHVFACVGVPVRDPVTRRQLGVLDITTWADRANPALTALARQAASVIEEGLFELSSRGARALLDEYLVSSRNRSDSVIAVGRDAFIGNAAAVQRLQGVGREQLWAIVSDALSSREHAELPLLTPSGATVNIHLRAVRCSLGVLGGALLEFGPAEPTPAEPTQAEARQPTRPREDTVGLGVMSPLTIGPAVMVARMAATGTPVCLVGEHGVGKRTLVASVADQSFPGRSLVVLDGAGDTTHLVEGAVSHLGAGRPVLVSACDALPEGLIGALLAAWRRAGSGAWLAFSLLSPLPTGSGGSAHAELSAAGIPIVSLPPLRSRVQDLRVIVPKMLARLSQGRVTAVTPQLMGRLQREPWPGNLTEVEALLQTMLAEKVSGDLDEEDLPPGFGIGVRRQLTPLEWMEREAIVEALHSCGGDKTRAAEAIGMSRASIYRKVKAYEIDARGI